MDTNPATAPGKGLPASVLEEARQGDAHAVAIDVSDSAYKGDVQAVVAWLDEVGDVDARTEEHGVTLLMVAAYGAQEAMVRMLLQRGASVNLQSSLGLTAHPEILPGSPRWGAPL